MEPSLSAYSTQNSDGIKEMGMVPLILQAAAHLAILWAALLSSLQTWDTNQKEKKDKRNMSSTIIQSIDHKCV